jgi:predicted O-methyltransferase YrrM
MLEEAVRAVLERLEREDAREREEGVAVEQRSRAIAPTTGRFLFSLVAPQVSCEVLELGGSRGYSTAWLAAGARILGGHVTSVEHDPRKCEAWRASIADARLEEWADLVEGNAFDVLASLEDVFDVVFLDAEKDDYEALFALARDRVEPGGLIIADNVLSHVETLGAYSAARQSDPTLSSVTVPLDRGLELTVVLSGSV